MSKARRAICSITPKGLEMCSALEEVMEFPHGQGTKYQGLKLNSMVNMTTHEFSRHLVVLKSGKHSKKGLVLNFCPFCTNELIEGAAADLASFHAKEAKKTARKASTVTRHGRDTTTDGVA